MKRKIIKKIIIFIILTILLGCGFAQKAVASETLSCSNRFLTLVNPVRDRNLWAGKTLDPIEQQYSDIKKYSFPATWLMQYNTLKDADLIKEIKSFDQRQEIGVFLEVSRELAGDSGVSFPIYVRWSDPGAVFLSAYSQPERRSLIDQLFSNFKKVFGFYPKSVGAWWIDSYSLNYLVQKYGVKTALIVADQKVTDSYGVWGQWWGFPYRPSKANILVPGSNSENTQNVVTIQWAQRDPTSAYGSGERYSRHSLQANDYILINKNIDYFKNLVSRYLDCRNSLGQITIGLETGQESTAQPKEYKSQLEYLSGIKNLMPVTMSDFADKYFSIYKVNPDKIVFGQGGAQWEMTTSFRENIKLGDYISYNQNLSFPDYFLSDKSNFLNRVMPISGKVVNYFPWFLLAGLVLLVISLRKKLSSFWLLGISTALICFGLLFRSNYQFGWQVFYGPNMRNLELMQAVILVLVFVLMFLLFRKFKGWFGLVLIPLSFGLDRIISVLRYTYLARERYFGLAFGISKFIGIKLSSRGLGFVNANFQPVQFQALTKFDFTKIWTNGWLYFLVYPLVHLLFAWIIWLIIRKKSKKVKMATVILLLLLFIWQIIYILGADPLSVKPL